MRLTNKKGALSLAINSIVVIVIAFVILGLGLGFVKNQLGSAEESTTAVQEQIRQQIMEDITSSNKKLNFPAQTLNIEKGKSKDIAIGVKNDRNGNLGFTIIVSTMDKQGDDGGEYVTFDYEGAIDFFYKKGPFTLKSTEAQAYNIKLTPKDKGTYLISLVIMENECTPDSDYNCVYAEDSFFITVI